jgi:hypothetical protein
VWCETKWHGVFFFLYYFFIPSARRAMDARTYTQETFTGYMNVAFAFAGDGSMASCLVSVGLDGGVLLRRGSAEPSITLRGVM